MNAGLRGSSTTPRPLEAEWPGLVGMVTNYERGRTAEHWARNELVEAGYIVVRSAGSKGPIDLVAIGALEIRLIQIKRCQGVKPPSFADDLAKLRELEVPDNCVKEMWIFVEGLKKWVVLPG